MGSAHLQFSLKSFILVWKGQLQKKSQRISIQTLFQKFFGKINTTHLLSPSKSYNTVRFQSFEARLQFKVLFKTKKGNRRPYTCFQQCVLFHSPKDLDTWIYLQKELFTVLQTLANKQLTVVLLLSIKLLVNSLLLKWYDFVSAVVVCWSKI